MCFLDWRCENLNFPYFRLFILGAGFSKPAGLPLGEELLQCVREVVKSKFQDAGWDGPLERDIEEWTSLYPDKPLDLERVFAYSHRKHYLGLSRSEERFVEASQSFVAAKEAIQQVLIRRTPSVIPKLYRDFAKRLRPGDVVLTFNYDTLLEQALDDVDKPYSLTPEWWLDEALKDSEEYKYVDLLKLHGSIDWYDRYFLDEIMRGYAEDGIDFVTNRDPIFGPDSSVPSECLAKGQVGAENPGVGKRILPRVFRVPNHAQHFPIKGRPVSKVVPFILPPAYDKLLGYDAILDLWEHLHEKHDSYSSMVIIGYSMPSYDSYAYEALGHLLVNYQRRGSKTAFQQHCRVPVQLITQADSAQLALKGIPFLESSKTQVWHDGFSSEALNWMDWGDGAK